MSSIEVVYTEARERLAELWDRAIADREPIRLTRRRANLVVLLAADEHEGLLETAHLPALTGERRSPPGRHGARSGRRGGPATVVGPSG